MASQPDYEIPVARPAARPVPRLTLVETPPPARDPEPLRWGLHPRVFKLMALSLFGYLAVLAYGFGSGAGMPLLVVICAVSFAGYLGLPLVMARAQPDKPGTPQPWREFMAKGVQLADGNTASGGEAVVLTLLMPVVMLAWGVAIVAIKANL